MNYDEQLQKLRAVLEPILQQLDYDRLGKYNASYYKNYADDPFESFVVTEWPYYKKVLDWYLNNVAKNSTVLEVGMFIPVVPLLLAWEGYRVTTIENLNFYGEALNPVIQLVEKQGVEFLNLDIMAENLAVEEYDCVNLLAVVEHLLGSPKMLLAKLHSLLKPEGNFVFVVPNQARLIRRLGLMFGGISVQPEYKDYYESDYPFEGHHREYVLSEVKYLMKASNFDVYYLDSIKYPLQGGIIKKLISFIGNILPMSFHQAFLVTSRKSSIKQKSIQ